MKLIALCRLGLIAAVLAHTCGCSRHEAARTKAEAPITGSPTDPAVEFKPEWKLGRSYTYRLETAHILPGRSRRDGASRQQEIEFAETYSVAVTNRFRTGIQQFGIQILALSLDIGDQDKYFFNFDSENKAVPIGSDPVALSMQRMINSRFGVDLSSKNKLVKLTGFREMTEKAIKDGSSWRYDGILRRMLDSHLLRQMLDIHHLPDKPLKIGESCPVAYELRGGSFPDSEVKTKHTFKGWQWRDNRKCAVLDWTGTIQPATNASPASTTLEHGKISGRTWYDPELAAIAGTAYDQSYTIIYRKRNGTNITESLRMPVQQHVSLSLRTSLTLDPSQWSEEKKTVPATRSSDKSQKAPKPKTQESKQVSPKPVSTKPVSN